MVRTNHVKSRAVGEILKGYKIRDKFFDRLFLKNNFTDEQRLSMLFNAVAICHQTRNLYSPSHNLYGWDYIEKAFTDLAENNNPLLCPDIVMKLSPGELQNRLLCIFSDTGDARNSSLDNIEERAKLYFSINKLIINKYQGLFSEFLSSTGNLLFNNGKGFCELLAESNAFSDPQYKKSSFLLKLLIDAGLYQFKDKQNYIPIVDYHMQRVLLRLGCVEVNDLEYDFKLKNNIPIETDMPVRLACIDAFNTISKISGLEVWVMNDIFWPLGRSCCNEITLCTDKRCSKNPCTFDLMIEATQHNQCIFEGVCQGYLSGLPKEYNEPNVETHYY